MRFNEYYNFKGIKTMFSNCHSYELVVEPVLDDINKYRCFILFDDNIVSIAYGNVFRFFNLFSIESQPLFITFNVGGNIIKFDFERFVECLDISFKSVYH
jgi:hypothetical protein